MAPKPVYISTTPYFRRGTSGLQKSDSKSQEAHPAKMEMYVVLRPLVFFFLSGHIALCCCSLEVGRQGDSRELWKGRMDEKVFQRRSLCPPLILWASSGKQRPQYVNLTAFRYTCPHACVHTGSAAVRASRLKIRKSFPEQLLA